MSEEIQKIIHYLSSATVRQRTSLSELAERVQMDRNKLDDVLLDALANGVIRGKLDLMTDTLAILDFEPPAPIKDELPALIEILQQFQSNLDCEIGRLDFAVGISNNIPVSSNTNDKVVDAVDRQFVDMIHHCQPRSDPIFEAFSKLYDSEASNNADRGMGSSSADRNEDRGMFGKMTRKAKEIGRRFMPSGGDVL